MNRKFIFILIGLMLLLLAGFFLLWWSYGQVKVAKQLSYQGDDTQSFPDNENDAIDQNNQTENTNTRQPINTGDATTTKNGPTLADAVALSRSFTERFGTFSNQNNYENINNLRSYMTPNMEKAADGIIAKSEAKKDQQNGYYGITTQALTTTTISSSAQKVTIIVTTQREESKETTSERKIFQQSAELQVVMQDGAWKVESIIWK